MAVLSILPGVRLTPPGKIYKVHGVSWHFPIRRQEIAIMKSNTNSLFEKPLRCFSHLGASPTSRFGTAAALSILIAASFPQANRDGDDPLREPSPKASGSPKKRAITATDDRPEPNPRAEAAREISPLSRPVSRHVRYPVREHHSPVPPPSPTEAVLVCTPIQTNSNEPRPQGSGTCFNRSLMVAAR